MNGCPCEDKDQAGTSITIEETITTMRDIHGNIQQSEETIRITVDSDYPVLDQVSDLGG